MSGIVLEINDKNNRSFKIIIYTPSSQLSLIRFVKDAKRALTRGGWFGGSPSGSWKTVDEGFIRFRSGETRSRFSGNGDLTTLDLLILGPEGIKAYDGQDRFGLQLFEYEDFFGANSEGEGFVIQPWVINLTPGRISWKFTT